MPSPFLYPPPAITQPVVIRNDGGGEVSEYMNQAYQYKLEGRRVEIRGSCRSACLLSLSVPNVCVDENAVVKAHDAYESISGVRRPDVTEKMLAALPKSVQSALDGKIQRDYTPESTLTYRELRVLGIPDCSKKDTIRASDSQRSRKVTYKIATPIDGLLNLFPFLKRK